MTGFRRWARWTLRSRLVAATAVLTGLALATSGVVGPVLLHAYLVDRIDDQLSAIGRALTAGTVDPRVPKPALDSRFSPRGYTIYRWYFFQPDGTLKPPSSVDADGDGPVLGSAATLQRRLVRPRTVGAGDGSGSWRVLAVPWRGDGSTVVIAASLNDVDATVDGLLTISLLVNGLILVLLVVVAAVVVRVGLRPLTRMEHAAGQISAGDLSRRVLDADPHTEPGRLGTALNVMLGRIEAEVAARNASEERLRRFVADASHELRTPLTSIRGFAELFRRGGAPPGPVLDETMRRIEDEAARMGLLVTDLLLCARLDAERPPRFGPVDLLAVAADSVRDANAREPGRAIRLAVPGGGRLEPVVVSGDESRLRQVAANLVANALEHTPPDAEVTVRVGVEPGRVAVLEVSDTGPGIAPADAPFVFERLYRAAPGRRRGRGSGLGLSIVASIVRAHGGRVELVTAPGKGATFRVLLPDSEVASS